MIFSWNSNFQGEEHAFENVVCKNSRPFVQAFINIYSCIQTKSYHCIIFLVCPSISNSSSWQCICDENRERGNSRNPQNLQLSLNTQWHPHIHCIKPQGLSAPNRKSLAKGYASRCMNQFLIASRNDKIIHSQSSTNLLHCKISR